MFDALFTSQASAGKSHRPITRRRHQRLYQCRESFTDLLPWMEYDPASQTFLLEDGISVGALFELTPAGTEARPEAFMQALRDNLQLVINEAIPEEDCPWIIQFYLQDEPGLQDLIPQLRAYVNKRANGEAYTEAYLRDLQNHLHHISKAGGLFVDEAVTGNPWRGQVRRIRAVLYRRLVGGAHSQRGFSPEEELNHVAEKIIAAFQSAGLRVRRGDGEAFYHWMTQWFNPAAAATQQSVSDRMPYPGDEDLPFGADLAESLLYKQPRSDTQSGIWWFDELAHRVITVQGLRRIPSLGHLTAERGRGDYVFSLFDRMPEYTTMVMTVVIKPQDVIQNHITAIRRAAAGDGAEAELARQDAEIAAREVADGNKLYPVALAFYIRAKDKQALRVQENTVNALLISNGLQPLGGEADVFALDSYLRNLPMNYEPRLDKTTRRSRLIFSQHIANLLPLYGRSRGTGHPGLVFYNRGAEPVVFDPLNANDRKKNGHMLILGPTGAGKSALLVYLIQQMMAVYKPRIFIIEAGNSFGLLGQHFKANGLTVNQVTLSPGVDVSLAPFRSAVKLTERGLAASRAIERALAVAEDQDVSDELPNGESGDNGEERRDPLGEMEIAARIMITGGDEREDARLTRADRLMIRNGILKAAQQVREQGRDQVITEDVVLGLRSISLSPKLPESRRHRASEMADSMELFCSGLAGHLFNRPGEGWIDADVTILEMGILAREGYEDQLTVAYIGAMDHINDLVERHQHEARPTLVITDEGHIITTNPLLAPYVVKITKMWRKYGAWFWIATQNLEDFPNASRKMLNMLEWWLCLVMPKEEVEQIARFKELTDEQRALLLAARKEPGHYTEGVVLSDVLSCLFRNVPPPLSLALAMTEQHEKAERMRIMREKNCTELEAAYHVAKQLQGQVS